MPAQKTTPDRVRAEVNTQEALRLRSAALPYGQIAARLGVSKSTAFGYVTRALEELREERRKRAGVLIDLELERLDIAQRGVWSMVLKGDVNALKVFLRLSERRSRLLGLDAPTKLSPTDPDGQPLTGAVMIYVPDNGRMTGAVPITKAPPAPPPQAAPEVTGAPVAPAAVEDAQPKPQPPAPPRRRVRRPRG